MTTEREFGVLEKAYDYAKIRNAQLERELSAANARIAELEGIVRIMGGMIPDHDITAPSQPTTLPESKQKE